MALKRPHRRDRRKTPPNRPGGPVNQISQCDMQSFGADEVFVDVHLSATVLGTPGFQVLELVSGDVDDPEGWAFFDDGVLNPVNFILVDSSGVVEIHPTTDLVGNAILIIPPFMRALTSTNGIVNGGGIFRMDFTPAAAAKAKPKKATKKK